MASPIGTHTTTQTVIDTEAAKKNAPQGSVTPHTPGSDVGDGIEDREIPKSARAPSIHTTGGALPLPHGRTAGSTTSRPASAVKTAEELATEKAEASAVHANALALKQKFSQSTQALYGLAKKEGSINLARRLAPAAVAGTFALSVAGMAGAGMGFGVAVGAIVGLMGGLSILTGLATFFRGRSFVETHRGEIDAFKADYEKMREAVANPHLNILEEDPEFHKRWKEASRLFRYISANDAQETPSVWMRLLKNMGEFGQAYTKSMVTGTGGLVKALSGKDILKGFDLQYRKAVANKGFNGAGVESEPAPAQEETEAAQRADEKHLAKEEYEGLDDTKSVGSDDHSTDSVDEEVYRPDLQDSPEDAHLRLQVAGQLKAVAESYGLPSEEDAVRFVMSGQPTGRADHEARLAQIRQNILNLPENRESVIDAPTKVADDGAAPASKAVPPGSGAGAEGVTTKEVETPPQGETKPGEAPPAFWNAYGYLNRS